MSGRDERLGMALRELVVPDHGPDFHARLAERLDREPPQQRPAPRLSGWRQNNMLVALAVVAVVAVAVGLSGMLVGNRTPVVIEAGPATIPTSVPATTSTEPVVTIPSEPATTLATLPATTPASVPATSPASVPATATASVPATTPASVPATTGVTLFAAPVPTTAPAAPPVPTTTATTLTTVPGLPDTPSGYALAAYDAWVHDDRAAAARVAEPTAVDALFARTWSSADGWEFLNCQGAAGSVLCTWQRPGERLVIAAPNSSGGRPVTSVQFQPSP